MKRLPPLLLSLTFLGSPLTGAQDSPIQKDPAFQQAQRQWQQKQRDTALAGFQALCDARPDDGMTWLAVADFLNLQEAHAETLPFAERALERVPGQRDVYLILSMSCIETGAYARAEEVMEKGVERFPEDAMMQFQCGTAKTVNKKTQEARRHYREAVRLEPSNARYQFALGSSYQRANELALAERHLKKACRSKNKHPDAPWNLAQVIAFQDRPDEAEPWFQKALTLPDNPLYRGSLQKARYHYAVFLYEQRRHAEAEALLRKFLTVNTEDRMVWMYLGRVLNALGQRDEARQAAARYRDLQQQLDRDEDRYLRSLIQSLHQEPVPEDGASPDAGADNG